jgi:hypothetical protein
VSGLGTGVATALAVNVGSAGAPLVNGGVLGTPSSGTVTNLTGTASININGTVGATTPATGNFTTLTENSVATVIQTDIGTAANEIPLNQYLGNLAYQDASSISGQVGVIAGTAALPSVVSATDTDTGLWFPAANTLAASVNGAEQFRVNATGLGIGTSSPAFKLDISVADTTAYSTSAYSFEPLRITNTGAGGVSGLLFQALSTGTANTAQATISVIAESASSKNTAITFGTRENSGGTIPERLRIDSAGNVGIGTSSPSGKLDVGSVAGAVTSGDLIVTTGSTTASVTVGRLSSTASDATTFNVRNRVGTSLFYVSPDGVKTATTISVGAATPSTSGAGITFPATQSASSDANTLDDYEEGTTAVTLSPETSGTITIDTANDAVAYTKIGRQVTITGQVNVSSVSAPVGSYVHVNGLPFTSADLSESSGRIGGAVTYYNGTSGTYTAQGVLMLEGGSQARMYLTASGVVAGAGFIFSFSYFTT